MSPKTPVSCGLVLTSGWRPLLAYSPAGPYRAPLQDWIMSEDRQQLRLFPTCWLLDFIQRKLCDRKMQCTHCIPTVGLNLQIISQSYFCNVTWSLAQSHSEKSSLIFPTSYSAYLSVSQNRAISGLLSGTWEIFCLLFCLWQCQWSRVGRHLNQQFSYTQISERNRKQVSMLN